jgi:hypothetical protein
MKRKHQEKNQNIIKVFQKERDLEEKIDTN